MVGRWKFLLKWSNFLGGHVNLIGDLVMFFFPECDVNQRCEPWKLCGHYLLVFCVFPWFGHRKKYIRIFEIYIYIIQIIHIYIYFHWDRLQVSIVVRPCDTWGVFSHIFASMPRGLSVKVEHETCHSPRILWRPFCQRWIPTTTEKFWA